MKKRMRTTILMLILLLNIIYLLGCQPTPEDLVVKSKAGDELQDAISQTNDLDQILTEDTHIKETIINDTEKITVNIDAEIITPNTENLPVAKVERGEFTQDEMDKIILSLFGNATLYDNTVVTKDNLEDLLVLFKKESTDLNSDMAQSNNITTISELKDFADARISETLKKLEDAPETMPILENIDVSAEYGMVSADKGRDTMAELHYNSSEYGSNISYLNFGDANYSRSLSKLDGPIELSLNDNQLNEPELIKLQQSALEFVSSMGIDDMVLSDVFYIGDNTNAFIGEEGNMNEWQEITSDKMFYAFSFNRVLNGVEIDNSFYLSNTDSNYDIPLRYEKFEVWFEDSEIVQFIWESKLKTTQVENENVALQIDSEQAVDLFSKQAFLKYTDMVKEYIDDVIIEIDTIKLSLARIKSKEGNGEYLIVPVWNFYGNVNLRATEENAKATGLSSGNYIKNGDLYTINDMNKSIITINALDGTILDRELGY